MIANRSSLFLAVWLVATAVHVNAQNTTAQLDSDRERIERERTRLQDDFVLEDAACYKKFAVNYCLADVNERRRSALSDLRRQEILINDEERKIRAEEQLRRSDQKAAAKAQEGLPLREENAALQDKARQERSAQKLRDRKVVQSQQETKQSSSDSRVKRNQQKNEDRMQRAANEGQSVRSFADRQRAAEDRKVKHEEARLKKSKPTGKPLPIPDQ
jgi:colicin import membrane protein